MEMTFKALVLAFCLGTAGLISLKAAEPKPIFELSFDGGADAVLAGGQGQPLKAENLSYADGVRGKSVYLSKDSFLEYAAEGNLKQERGTVSLWFKPKWDIRNMIRDQGTYWHCLFSEPFPKVEKGRDSRIGSGAFWLWFWGPYLRGDAADVNDSFICSAFRELPQDSWTHIAFTWDIEKGTCLYMNGISIESSNIGDDSPFLSKGGPDYSALKNKFASFFVGSQDRGSKADGLIDDFRIYDKVLTQNEIFDEIKSEERAAGKALLPSFTVTLRRYYCLEGEPAEIKWTVKSICGRLPSGVFSWRIEDPFGATIAAEKGQNGELGSDGNRDFIAKIKPGTPGECRLVVDSGVGMAASVPIWVFGKENPYLKKPGTKLELKLLETIEPAKGLPSSRFVSTGSCVKGSLGGSDYLEAGSNQHDRFAIKVELPEADVPYLIEWDYPDDKIRTIEMTGQQSISVNDFGLQTGVFCGDEYPLSMKTLTHRSIFWAGSKEAAFIFMTIRRGAPAAVSQLRIYSIVGGLPDAGVSEPKPVNGWTRSIGFHFEDPAMGSDFGVPNQFMPFYEKHLDRLIAYMKWSGQNMLAYPAVWYQGRIGSSYLPRPHPEDYMGCILTKFEANGLYFMPAINIHNIKVEGVALNEKTIADGSLHDTPIMILSDGKPNPGGWHGTPPNFNPLHPVTQAYLSAQIDELLDRCAGSPSFKGVVMHLTMHTFPWFGSLKAGYNDYNIEAFEKDTGIVVPVKRDDPARGKLYYEWLMANAKEAWINWRCQRISAFYRTIAAKMAARRPDLKLSLCSYNPTISDLRDDPRYGQEDYVALINRESGLDPKFYADTPNIILSQTSYPADYRWSGTVWTDPLSTNARAAIRDAHFKQESYALLKDASFPWINMHDRYWEENIGANSPLRAGWLNETAWRVSTLNPNVNSFLESFILPLLYADVMGFTKGGYLVGTCGVEEKLAEFSRAYRALPAEKFSDLRLNSKVLKARFLKADDGTWLYALNASYEPASISFVLDKREGLVMDLAGKQEVKMDGMLLKVDLKPLQLRSFKLPRGVTIMSAE
ncbi:MAG: hypothetical protein A2X45_09295 [Lentisphaerae bacterium GWF2_50_93]|nr:MAG: hypothetical protein A2X45_09295 [Lentisphaerae bacterium GWF2_50_93]